MSVVRLGRAHLDGAVVALIELDGAVYPLADCVAGAPASLDAVFADWTRWRAAVEAAQPAGAPVEVDPASFLAPLVRPPHLICIGTNYRDHIAEMKIPADPQFPYAFLKPLTTIAPPAGPVVLPTMSKMVDWEAELGVVIGTTARNVAHGDALGVVAGYLPLNDVSARDWIVDRPSLGIDWVMQKGHDAFTPLGPWVTLASAVPDPQVLPVQCRLNGELVQDSSTANMLFSVADIIVHVSAIMTLSAGDIIATGTPAGVGFGRNPQVFLKDGDVVEVSLGLLGRMETHFVAEGTA